MGGSSRGRGGGRRERRQQGRKGRWKEILGWGGKGDIGVVGSWNYRGEGEGAAGKQRVRQETLKGWDKQKGNREGIGRRRKRHHRGNAEWQGNIDWAVREGGGREGGAGDMTKKTGQWRASGDSKSQAPSPMKLHLL